MENNSRWDLHITFASTHLLKRRKKTWHISIGLKEKKIWNTEIADDIKKPDQSSFRWLVMLNHGISYECCVIIRFSRTHDCCKNGDPGEKIILGFTSASEYEHLFTKNTSKWITRNVRFDFKTSGRESNGLTVLNLSVCDDAERFTWRIGLLDSH